MDELERTVTSMQITTQQQYLAAVEQATNAARAYYQDGSLLMADGEYDTLVRTIATYEATHPETRIEHQLHDAVAAGTAEHGDVIHRAPMLSLDNSFDASNLQDWLTGRAGPFTTEPKYDGLSLAATYRNGELVRIATRGDGTAGENVTHAAGRIAGLPDRIDTTTDLEIRGEVIFTHENYDAANRNRIAAGKKAFVNPRNAAAGTLRTEHLEYDAQLTFYAHGQIGLETETHSAAMHALREFGINTGDAGLALRVHASADEVLAEVASFAARRETLPLDVDGLVIKIDHIATQQELGTSSRAPKWGIAFKYPALEATSTLLEVEWTVGRTGRITPRARIEPVFVAGTTVTYATLHNAEDIKRKDLRIGDTVLVKRAGEVIPRIEAPIIEQRTGDETEIAAPAQCPRCAGDINRNDKVWRCTRGRGCGAAESIRYAASRDCLDIEGLGEFLVGELVRSGRVETVADLFTLTRDDLLGLPYASAHTSTDPKTGEARTTQPRMQEKSVENLLGQIEKARTQPLSRVFCALGVRMTGRSMSRRIAKHFTTMPAILAADTDTLTAVDGIGPERAAVIREELTELAETIEKLVTLGVNMTESTDTNTEDSPLTGKTLVVTGTMTGRLEGRSRDEVHAMIEAAGGKTSSSVSKKTSILVAGDAAGSKLAKAAELGVTVLSPDELAELLGLD